MHMISLTQWRPCQRVARFQRYVFQLLIYISALLRNPGLTEESIRIHVQKVYEQVLGTVIFRLRFLRREKNESTQEDGGLAPLHTHRTRHTVQVARCLIYSQKNRVYFTLDTQQTQWVNYWLDRRKGILQEEHQFERGTGPCMAFGKSWNTSEGYLGRYVNACKWYSLQTRNEWSNSRSRSEFWGGCPLVVRTGNSQV